MIDPHRRVAPWIRLEGPDKWRRGLGDLQNQLVLEAVAVLPNAPRQVVRKETRGGLKQVIGEICGQHRGAFRQPNHPSLELKEPR